MTGLLRPCRCGFQAFAAAPDTRPAAGRPPVLARTPAGEAAPARPARLWTTDLRRLGPVRTDLGDAAGAPASRARVSGGSPLDARLASLAATSGGW
ncbi:hypothetical protein ABT294_14845 [Nonomuraea sp. NPDC000554]|uniref:hypothetical protein n=1 Tax=Nonomuraea sp. NPDC000554 TaxID=3154259 RepID=UPI003325B008